jgi:high-affinity iron transporter
MLQAFIIVLREGFESFLIVAIALAFLRRTGRTWMTPLVYAGTAVAIAASAGLGFLIDKGINQPLWEGILAVVAMVLVTSLVIHMWRVGPEFKKNMETKMTSLSSNSSRWAAGMGIFLFTVLMISREGMETALALIQIRNTSFVSGILLGLLGTLFVSWLWVKYSSLINLKRFFRVTGIFLLIFVAQIGLTAFHEFSEAGVLPNSDVWHAATEPYSPDGRYGQWFSLLTVGATLLWLIGAAIKDRFQKPSAS